MADLKRIVAELHLEREAVEEMIVAAERLAAIREGKKRRGRPPKWLAERKRPRQLFDAGFAGKATKNQT